MTVAMQRRLLAATLHEPMSFHVKRHSSESLRNINHEVRQVFLSVLLIWLAWVLVMVVVARALQAASPTLTMRRWSRAICAMGTTVPWFGFATAQMMAE